MDLGSQQKRCAICHQVKPQEAFANRARSSDGKQRHCRECARPVLDAATMRRRAARQQVHTTPPSAPASSLASPVPLHLPAQGASPLPVGARPSLRAVVEEEARAQWPKLAKKLVSMAAGGDRAMLKLLMEYMLGKPDVQRDDDGPDAFWASLLARLQAQRAEGDADLLALDDAAGGAADAPNADPWAGG